MSEATLIDLIEERKRLKEQYSGLVNAGYMYSSEAKDILQKIALISDKIRRIEAATK